MTKEQAIVYLRFSGFSDEQIKAIEEAFTCDKCVYSTSEGCQYDDITETIPPFDKTRWIPVSERLPEKADLYLVNFDDGAYHLAYFNNGACDYSGVIAWMPLPEPYKAEGSGE
jgi:hypothetical protein